METEELEQLLQGAAETQNLEFKASTPWNVRSLAKDILALSNVRGGGRIIVGVEDETYARQGVDRATADSYRPEQMRDQMAAYADPYVNFSVSFPTVC